MFQSSVLDVNTHININEREKLNEKNLMFITLSHLFITLYLMLVNDTIKDWGLIVYTLLYNLYSLMFKVSYNFLPVVS